ncbi:unnamed protein product [Pleuronectes platessa]|uniref:Uncharacterized protein n=1 Tax=Pleuronectes platessa TaxID=8262 RepID=A0A9N7U4I3_PLEPL|nr:unnamed protein product [Pleuronectes platessa]
MKFRGRGGELEVKKTEHFSEEHLCVSPPLSFTVVSFNIDVTPGLLNNSGGVRRHDCVDEVTVNRDKPPLLLWEQAQPLPPDLSAEPLHESHTGRQMDLFTVAMLLHGPLTNCIDGFLSDTAHSEDMYPPDLKFAVDCWCPGFHRVLMDDPPTHDCLSLTHS